MPFSPSILPLTLLLAAQTHPPGTALEGALPPAPVLADLAARDTVVWTGDELLRRGFRTLGDALSFEAGFVRSRDGSGARYALRGIRSGIALVIDGVPQVVDGERDVLDIDELVNLADVERVEIVRGPATAMNGVGALTGVVRITTRRPGLAGASVRAAGTLHASDASSGQYIEERPIGGERELAVDGTAREGDFGLRATARVRGGAPQLWRLRAVPLRYEQIDRVVRAVTKVDVDVVPADDQTLNGRVAVSLADLLVDVAAAHSLELSPISSFSGARTDDPQERARSILRARALWQRWLGPIRLETALTGARHQRNETIPLFPRRGVFRDGGVLAMESTALTAGVLLRADIPLSDQHRLIAGLFGDVTANDAHSSSTDPRTGLRTPELVRFSDRTGTLSLATEYQGDFGLGLHVTTGVVVEAHTAFSPAVAPRLAVAWDGDGWRLQGSYAEGTRAPDRYDMRSLSQAVVDGRVIGAGENADLRPERSRTLEVASSYQPTAGLSSSLRLFGSRHEDSLMQRVDGTLLVPANLGPRTLIGGEASGRVDAARGLLHVAAALAAAHTLEGPATGDDLLQTIVDVSLTPTSEITVGSRGRALLLQDLPGSAVVDVWGSLRLFDGGACVVGTLRNALDGREAVFDRNALPTMEPVSWPGPGRTLYVSVEARL